MPGRSDKGCTTEGVQEHGAVISCIWSMKTHTHTAKEGTDTGTEREALRLSARTLSAFQFFVLAH